MSRPMFLWTTAEWDQYLSDLKTRRRGSNEMATPRQVLKMIRLGVLLSYATQFTKYEASQVIGQKLSEQVAAFEYLAARILKEAPAIDWAELERLANGEPELPPLEGSPADCAWAKAIRKKLVPLLERVEFSVDRTVVDAAINQREARFWIAHRACVKKKELTEIIQDQTRRMGREGNESRGADAP